MLQIKTNMDDEVNKQKNNSDTMLDGGDILPPIGFRRTYNPDDKIDKFLRNYNGYFLPIVSGILRVIFLLN